VCKFCQNTWADCNTFGMTLAFEQWGVLLLLLLLLLLLAAATAPSSAQLPLLPLLSSCINYPWLLSDLWHATRQINFAIN
jgi:hypothetical protein